MTPALQAGDWRLTLRPVLGGAVDSLTWRGRPILRPTPQGAGDSLQTACFPLVPFANRVVDGGFHFEGERVALPVLPAFAPHALHGEGWRATWRIEQGTDRSARLAHTHEAVAGRWPWRYRAEQVFDLDEDGLTLALSVRNDDARVMPAGLGLHPYFPRDGDTRLAFGADAAWDVNAPGMPRRAVAPGGPLDWSAGPRVDGMPFTDHAFSGWGQEARLIHDGLTIRVSATGAPCVQVFTPPGEPWFCVEAVSHRPGALNWPGEPFDMARLAPGESLTLTLRVTVD